MQSLQQGTEVAMTRSTARQGTLGLVKKALVEVVLHGKR